VEKQSVPVTPPRNGAEKAGRPPKPTYERKIMREGVLFTIPHPSRVYYDISQPLSKLNNDKGPRWLGHWDVVTVGDVLDNPLYFNRESIALDTNVYTFFANYQAYFAQYYGGNCNWENAQKLFPEFSGRTSAALLALNNDRVANIGAWAQDYRAVPTVLDQHYMKVIPKDLGLGTYPDPVWIRFVTAANTTVVYAEICGSLPASVNSYNACDGLLENRSFAEDAIQWQQMLTNQLNMLVRAQYQAMVEIWALNKDGMTKGDIERIVNQLKNPDYTNIANAVMVYSQEKLAQRAAVEPKGTDRLGRIMVDNAARIKDIFDQMVQTLAMAERLMFFSPQELGQVSPRTITAEEVKTVNNTTLGIRDFHLVGVKKQMDADKRIIHDSYMAFGSEDLEVPVAERYDPKVIEAAGFEIVDDGSGHPPDGLFTIRGKKLGLYYNYTYTTRNTDDTPPEAAEAQGLAQIYEVTLKDPNISALLTNAQRIEFFNSMAQKISPNFPRINLPEGVDPNARGQTQVDQLEQQMKQFLPQIGQALQSQQQQIQQLATKQAESDASMKAVTQALNQLTSAVTGAAKARAGKEPSTARGTVSPTIPRGAPPTGGRAARPVPAL
jgi:hypothetical protein